MNNHFSYFLQIIDEKWLSETKIDKLTLGSNIKGLTCYRLTISKIKLVK